MAYFVSPYVQTQTKLRTLWDQLGIVRSAPSQGFRRISVPRVLSPLNPSHALVLALLTLLDRHHWLVASAVCGFKLKQSIANERRDDALLFDWQRANQAG